jgi:hypothetical protein
MSDQKPTTELTDSSPAPSNPLFKYVRGYPRIAERMARKTETASFRRFSALQARTLLHMPSAGWKKSCSSRKPSMRLATSATRRSMPRTMAG